jgi:outer membrane protein assembly factor BamB
MAVTGNGVALSSGNALLVYDGDGNRLASVKATGPISSPVAGADGSIYFADSISARRVDASGRPVWQTPLGASEDEREVTPGKLALDTAGRLYISASDGKLWILRSEDGSVVSSVSLGLLQGRARGIELGIGEVLLVDRSGSAATGSKSAALGLLSTRGGGWVGEVTIGTGTHTPWSIAGHDIGLVVSAYVGNDTERDKTDTLVLDPCGRMRWRVPGDYTVPLAISYEDDLIVMDRSPRGSGAYEFALRRFSRDGDIVAGPVEVPDAFCGRGFVGADDTFYYTGWTSDGYRLRAFDSSLHERWSIPFPHCPDAAVMNGDGKIFTAKGTSAKLLAVQTPSPGPGRVSWGQVTGDVRATRWLGP